MTDKHAINFSWLLRLRWGAATGQAVLILAVDRILRIDLPLLPLFSLIAAEVGTNALATWLARRLTVQEWMVAAVMALDVMLFTGLLALAGGPLNPFSFLYVVYLALAAVVLRPTWTWILAAFSLGCFGALFFEDMFLARGTDVPHDPHSMRLHLEGMWVAFGVAAGFIVYFVQRVTRALAEREAELADARNLTARNEKLASLATLAAGAAHQLSTPLSTIAVVARELERQLAAGVPADDAAGDARLIREQVERCREILSQLATDAGAERGEAFAIVSLQDLIADALRGLEGAEQIRVSLPAEQGSAVTLRVPRRALAQALRAVLKNAIEASRPEASIALQARLDEGACRIEVHDQGVGMTPEVLAHAGEPFFTTKGPDRGMGLGLFLVRAVVERLGGDVVLRSALGSGTNVVVAIPAATPAVRSPVAAAQEAA